jgi:hypothetical protein
MATAESLVAARLNKRVHIHLTFFYLLQQNMTDALATQVEVIISKQRARRIDAHDEDMSVLAQYAAVLRKRTKGSLQLTIVSMDIQSIDASYLAFLVLADVETLQVRVPRDFGRESLVRALSLVLFLKTSALHTITLRLESAMPTAEIQSIIDDAEKAAARLDATMLSTFLELVGFQREATVVRNTRWKMTSASDTTVVLSAMEIEADGDENVVEMEATAPKRGAEEMDPETSESIAPLNPVQDLDARLVTGLEFFALEEFASNILYDRPLFREWWQEYIFTPSGEDISAAWATRVNEILRGRGSLAKITISSVIDAQVHREELLVLVVTKQGVRFATVEMEYSNGTIDFEIDADVRAEFERGMADAIRDFQITRFYRQIEVRKDIVKDWFQVGNVEVIRKLLKERARQGSYPYFAVLSGDMWRETNSAGNQVVTNYYKKEYKADGHTESMGTLKLSSDPSRPVIWEPSDYVLGTFNEMIVKSIAAFDMEHYKKFEHWEECKSWWISANVSNGGVAWANATNSTFLTLKSNARIEAIEGAPETYKFLYWRGDRLAGTLVVSENNVPLFVWEKNE